MWWLLVVAAGLGGIGVGAAAGVVAGAVAFAPAKPKVRAAPSWDAETTEPVARTPAIEALWELEPCDDPTVVARRVDVPGPGR